MVLVTMGDPGGIGPEVSLKALRKIKTSRPITLIGAAQSLSSKPSVPFIDITEEARRLYSRRFAKKGPFKIERGKVSAANACVAWASLEKATALLKKKQACALVTAPINKTAMRLIDPNFDGHTEYLAARAGRRSFAMMFEGPRLRVTLCTIHVAVKNVSKLIKKELVLEKIKLTHDFLKKFAKIKKPRIAVCALNPHGRETGTEDEARIRPAVQKAKAAGINASGPFSADQLFHEAYHGRYDAVVSMYHDQGLTPFKMIAFDDGVNVTLGLPYVRTSPDHGTAFDIAGKNKARPQSMLAALRLALRLSA